MRNVLDLAGWHRPVLLTGLLSLQPLMQAASVFSCRTLARIAREAAARSNQATWQPLPKQWTSH